MSANGSADPGRVAHIVRSALAALEASRARLDDLNVYPVADGDTGTNMTLTARAVVDALDGRSGGDLPSEIARAALFGARGNSGVILSQIVRAALEQLQGELDAPAVAAALRAGADAAYAAVQHPVEGTILTVARELAEEAERLAPERPPLGDLLPALVRHGERAVARTPEQLPLLREAGVVDAGAAGLVEALRGIAAAVTGERIPATAPLGATLGEAAIHQQESRFRYCTSFVVEGDGLDRDLLHAELVELGDSLLVVGDPRALKVHVHTDDPGAALRAGTAVGVVDGVEIANMHRQEAERAARLEAAAGVRQTAVLAVANGVGNARLFRSLGAVVLDGGDTMNPSTAELLAALDRLHAREALLLPNDPNVLLAAEHAAREAQLPTTVVATSSLTAGLCALVAFDGELPAAENASALEEAAAAVASGAVAVAARSFDLDGARVDEGSLVGLREREPVVAGDDFEDVAVALVAALAPTELVTLLAGRDAPPLEALVARLDAAHPGIELEAHDGGQASTLLLVAAQ